MNEAQRKLAETSGTPTEFARACDAARAQGMITQKECEEAVERYWRLWNEAYRKPDGSRSSSTLDNQNETTTT